MSIVLNGTTGITTPDIDSTSGLDAADLTGALPDLDGSALTGIVIPPIFDPVAVSGATQALDVGSYNFFDGGTLTVANTPVSFTSVPTNARWSYSFKTTRSNNQWNISTVSYLQRIAIGSQETSPQGLFFKPDGTKMYVIGYTGDDINEYNLSTAWDITTAVYLQNFYVGSQDTIPMSIFFKPDGLKMYVSGLSGNDVNEYNLSTAWDISTSSFLRQFYVNSQDTDIRGIFFKPDGTKMYGVAWGTDRVYEWDLSTAWNITTASYLQLFSVASQETSPLGLFFKPDGTKMYVVGEAGRDVNEYNLSTAWDISTASYLQNFSVSGSGSNPTDVFFKPDGLKMYVLNDSGDDLFEYDLGTASAVTLPATVENVPSQALSIDKQVTYDFFTMDGGTTVKLIGEEVV